MIDFVVLMKKKKLWNEEIAILLTTKFALHDISEYTCMKGMQYVFVISNSRSQLMQHLLENYIHVRFFVRKMNRHGCIHLGFMNINYLHSRFMIIYH